MLFWLSFADSNRPTGEQFLGVAIVEAIDIADATEKCWRLGINPGGEVLSVEVPEEKYESYSPHTNKLLTKEEVVRLFGPPISPKKLKQLLTVE